MNARSLCSFAVVLALTFAVVACGFASTGGMHDHGSGAGHVSHAHLLTLAIAPLLLALAFVAWMGGIRAPFILPVFAYSVRVPAAQAPPPKRLRGIRHSPRSPPRRTFFTL